MEVINVSGYTTEDKIQIGKSFYCLTIKEHGLKSKDLKLGVRVMESIIEGYTRSQELEVWKKI